MMIQVSKEFSQQSSRKLTADVGVIAIATFLSSSFWKRECNIKNNEDSKQTFKRCVDTGTYLKLRNRIFAR